DQWLLLHKHDEYAVPGWDPEDYPASVLSGRTSDEVKADPERIWRADLPPAQASVPVRRTIPAATAADLANLDKALFPARPGGDPVTKRQLIRYTAEIAPVAVPYLAGRPLNMHRFPGGADTKGFWHKQLPDHAPDWLPRWHDPSAGPGKTSTYLVVDEPAALVWAANFGALEWHAWTA